MDKRLLLIKLGGSLISDKTKVNVVRTSEINKVSKQLKDFLDKNKDIFTGAGGFGHPVAEKFINNLEKGRSQIKKAVKKLNQYVVNSLNENGLKALSVEPDKTTKYLNGKMISLSSEYIIELFNEGVIPVFHADLVLDRKIGTSVLSMDKFLVDCAIYFKNKGFKIEKALFIGTTPGVISKYGKTVPTITKKNFSNIKKVFYPGKDIDVSGGMRYKVEQCLRLANIKIKSYITNDFLKRGTLVA